MAFFSKKKNKEQPPPPAASAPTPAPAPVTAPSSSLNGPGQTSPSSYGNSNGPNGLFQQQQQQYQGQQQPGSGYQRQQQPNMYPISGPQGPNTYSGFVDGPYGQGQPGGAPALMSNGVVAGASPTPYNQPQHGSPQQQSIYAGSGGGQHGSAGHLPPRQFAHTQSGSESSMNPLQGPQQQLRGPLGGYSQGAPPLQGFGPATDGQNGPSAQAPTGRTGQSSSSPVSYPWSQRPVRLAPVQPVGGASNGNSQELSPSPFPRYGHSVNPLAQSSTGDLYLFGGLVKDSVKNDLYMITCSAPGLNGASPADSKALAGAPISISLVETRGEVPSPRVGHTSVSVGNVLIVWGGDTKMREEDPQDDSLYLLNLGSRDWTLVKVHGPAPQGRYGHAAAIRGSKFYIFGGQQDVPPGTADDAAFLNDLWCFDLQNLKAGKPQWTQIEYSASAPTPPKRSGHTIVTHGDCLYVFGGTDGRFHYNDTWCFSTSSSTWTELSCIGYIPVPREGHAAALVDDVVYVFGGRNVDGKDLDDLAAFKISNQRWYMFTNMGPAPQGRADHAMASWQNKVFVLGGETIANGEGETSPYIHMLDTGKIKYPSDSRNNQQGASRKTSNPKMGAGGAPVPPNKPMQNLVESDQRRAASPTGSDRGDASQLNGFKTASSKPGGPLSQSQQSTLSSPGRGTASPGPGQQASQVPTRKPSDVGRRAMSPINEQNPSGYDNGPTRALSPTSGHQGLVSSAASQPNGTSMSTPPSRSAATLDSGAATTSTSPPANVNINALRANARSPSPQLSRSLDAHAAAAQNATPSDEVFRLRSQEKWLRAALSAATAQGFVLPESEAGEIFTPDKALNKRQADALLALKREISTARAVMQEEGRLAEERVQQANKARATALQEASFYRSKTAALESNSTNDLVKLERGRVQELEKRVLDIGTARATLQRRLDEVESETQHLRESAQLATERESASVERAEAAEASYSRALTDYAELQRRSHTNESSMQEHLRKIANLESQVAQLGSQHTSTSTRAETAESAVDQHVRALGQTQATLAAASNQAREMEALWMRAREDLAEHQDRNVQLQSEVRSSNQQLENAKAHIEELERALQSGRDEAQSLRALTSDHLSTIVNASRENGSRSLGAANADSTATQTRALQEEADKHKELAREAHTQLVAAQSEARETKLLHVSLEKQIAVLRSEVAGLRSRHASALEASSRAQAAVTQRDLTLREKASAIEAAEVKAGLLRNILAENGLSFDDGGSPSLGSSQISTSNLTRRIAELESRLEQRIQSQEELQALHSQARSDAESSRQRLKESEDQIDSLNRQIGELKINGSTGADAQRSSASAQAEQDLVALKEKYSTLETTHLKAVQYVKGTEKMFRRMKDELTKHKERNESLEAQLAEANASSGGHARKMSSELRPELDDLRSQLADLRKQSEQSSVQNGELQEHIKVLQADYDQTLERHQTSSSSRLAECEAELEQLQEALEKAQHELDETLAINKQLNAELSSAMAKAGSSAGASGGDATSRQLEADLTAALNKTEWLKRENETLEERCRESENKVSLLLDHIESSGGVEAVASSLGHSTDHDQRNQDLWKGSNGEARSDAGSDYSASLDSFQQQQRQQNNQGSSSTNTTNARPQR